MLILTTKDGSRFGNAILYGGGPSCYAVGETVNLFFVETDFGHKMRMTWNEVNEMFNISRVCSYDEWANDRANLQIQLHEH
jgi:hypothetical protein